MVDDEKFGRTFTSLGQSDSVRSSSWGAGDVFIINFGESAQSEIE
jgi:hypothetical protein